MNIIRNKLFLRLVRIYLGEFNQYNRHSTLMSAYRHIKDPKFMYSIIREKGEVYKALKQFFGKKEIETY